MLKKILFSLAIGIIAALYVSQNDTWVHDAVRHKIQETLGVAWNCRIACEVESVNLFVPTVTLKNISCTPVSDEILGADNSWSWHAQRATVSASWITFLVSSMLGLDISLDGVAAQTHAQGYRIPLVHDHISRIVYGSAGGLPLYVRGLIFNDSSVHLVYPSTGLALHAAWSSQSYNASGSFKTYIRLHTGSLSVGNATYLDTLAGALQLDCTSTITGLKSVCDVQTTARALSVLPCCIRGVWQSDHGDFTLTTTDGALKIDPIQVALNDKGLTCNAIGSTNLETVFSCTRSSRSSAWKGECAAQVAVVLAQDQQSVIGTCTAKNVGYGGVDICNTVDVTYTYSPGQWNGTVFCKRDGLGALKGNWQYGYESGLVELTMQPTDPVIVPGYPAWVLDPYKSQVRAQLDKLGSLSCSYKGQARHAITGKKIDGQGAILWNNPDISCAGNVGRWQYAFGLSSEPSLSVKKIMCKDTYGATLLNIAQDAVDAKKFNGELDVALLRYVCQHYLNHTLQGEGRLALHGNIDDDRLHVYADLKHGIIRLPKTYNFITAFSAHMICDATQKNVAIQDISCTLHRGKVSCPRAIIQANDRYAIEFAYAPFTFESCLLNIKKDVFALFSGNLAIRKEPNKKPHAQGSFVIERAYVKENLYSQAFQKNIAGFPSLIVDADKQDMTCDISLETQEPLRVDTAFLEASANIALRVTNTVRDPNISGSIDIVSGSLAFPYKPLLITKGSIYFMPGQAFDPLIELVAKNKIKKYNVGLHVTGSLLNHHIALESSPPLTDEQIIALLLVGSEEQSLNIVVPALLMQNLKTLIFDSEQSPLRLHDFFKSWLTPFKGVHLVPSFSDQSGRGGLRGAIEIEINDRWRAMAQKNFSLTEDTRFEVEYALSDDVTVRGIRNERKDVAGEVEMRWKFGR
jgi:hypothetical protein